MEQTKSVLIWILTKGCQPFYKYVNQMQIAAYLLQKFMQMIKPRHLPGNYSL